MTKVFKENQEASNREESKTQNNNLLISKIQMDQSNNSERDINIPLKITQELLIELRKMVMENDVIIQGNQTSFVENIVQLTNLYVNFINILSTRLFYSNSSGLNKASYTVNTTKLFIFATTVYQQAQDLA